MAADGLVEASARPDRARGLSILLASLGLLDSIYLTVVKLANATAICAGIGDCEAVNSSRFSELGGMPVALLGVGAYLAILVLLIFEPKFGKNSDYARLGIFGIALSGALYSAYLTYVEIAILRAICPFCVASAVLITALCAVGVTRLSEVYRCRA